MSSPNEFIAEPDVVMLDLRASSGEEAVRALHARLLAASGDVVLDGPRLLEDVVARMRLAPVCIADDVALPHARTDAVRRIVLAVGRAVEPIPFDDGCNHVRLVFLVGTPKGAVSEYLRAVALLTRQLRNPAVRHGLAAAHDEAEFRTALADGVTTAR